MTRNNSRDRILDGKISKPQFDFELMHNALDKDSSRAPDSAHSRWYDPLLSQRVNILHNAN